MNRKYFLLGAMFPLLLGALGRFGTGGGGGKLPRTAFGELSTAVNQPRVQIDAIYDILATDIETHTESSATATASGGLFQASTGTNAAGLSIISSKRKVRYRPGQGTLLRFTADFTTGVANSIQLAGGMSSEQAVGFGYNGADFGVFRRTGGLVEIQTLTISAGASGSETATVTLDGSGESCSITSGSVQLNAQEVAVCVNALNDWSAEQEDDKVIIIGKVAGDKAGAFSYSTDGTGAGSFAETRAGVAHTYNWTTQANFNINTVPWLDPTKLNIYGVEIQYLGAGNLVYVVEDPNTGSFVSVHMEKYANSASTPSFSNPTFQLGFHAENTGNTTNLTVASASAAGFVQGNVDPFRNPRSTINEKQNVGTTFTSIVGIKNSLIRPGGSVFNVDEVLPVDVSFASQSGGGRPTEFALFVNPTCATGAINWQVLESGESSVLTDVGCTTISGGRQVFSQSLSQSGEVSADLSKYKIRIEPGDALVLAARAKTGTINADAAISWIED